MSLAVALAIAVPLLFVIGTVLNAWKAQKRLEQGTLKRVLEERRKAREQGMSIKPYDDSEDDWGKKTEDGEQKRRGE